VAAGPHSSALERAHGKTCSANRCLIGVQRSSPSLVFRTLPPAILVRDFPIRSCRHLEGCAFIRNTTAMRIRAQLVHGFQLQIGNALNTSLSDPLLAIFFLVEMSLRCSKPHPLSVTNPTSPILTTERGSELKLSPPHLPCLPYPRLSTPYSRSTPNSIPSRALPPSHSQSAPNILGRARIFLQVSRSAPLTAIMQPCSADQGLAFELDRSDFPPIWSQQ
jgi:hypothetical protein